MSTVGCQSVEYRPSVGRVSGRHWPSVDTVGKYSTRPISTNISAECRYGRHPIDRVSVGRVLYRLSTGCRSVEYWPSVGWVSVDSIYRPIPYRYTRPILYRPTPSIDRVSANTITDCRQGVLLADDTRVSVGRYLPTDTRSVEYRPSVGRVSVGRVLAECRYRRDTLSTLGRVSIGCRSVEYRHRFGRVLAEC